MILIKTLFSSVATAALAAVAFSSTTASAQDMAEIRVEVTGDTENGIPWDGRRYFFVPAEVGTVSPPDLAICLFRESGEIGCWMRDPDKFLSLCPNRNHCTFYDVPIPAGEVFGLAVFDLDPFGHSEVKTLQRKTSELLTSDCRDPVARLKCEAQRRLNTLQSVNEDRMEWIDSIVFSDRRRSNTVDKVSAIMRQFVAANAPMGKNSDPRKHRIGGAFKTVPLEDCVFPAPSCVLDYSAIEISLEGEF